MKKVISLIVVFFILLNINAQIKLETKAGAPILPEEGDWAIGFDADPFLNYIGNLLNSNAVAPSANWTNSDLAITGKMFKDDNTAYRLKLRLGLGGTKYNNMIDTSTSLFGDPAYMTDTYSYSYMNIQMGAGIENRRGKGRVQGVYGGEMLIGMSGTNESISYADQFDDQHTATWTTLFSENPNNITTTSSNGPRPTEINEGSTFTMQLRGFVGVEYFIFSKISVAAEYGWGLIISSQGEGSTVTESFGLASASATESSIVTTTTKTPGNSNWGIDTDNNGANLSIIFHF